MFGEGSLTLFTLFADVAEVDQVETSIGGYDAATAPTRRGGPLGGLGQG